MTNFGESGPAVPHFIPEPRNFAEVTKLSENIRKPWLKATLKEITNLINNQTFMIEDPKDGEPVTPCMDVYKAKIQSDGSLNKIKLATSSKEQTGDVITFTQFEEGDLLTETRNDTEIGDESDSE